MAEDFTAGEVPTADKLNRMQTGQVRAKAWLASNTSTTSGTLTLVPFASESFDYGTTAMHSTVTNNSRVIAPIAGCYFYKFLISFDANATGRRVAQVRLNAAGSNSGGTQLESINIGPGPTSGTVVDGSGFIELAASDYLELFGLQLSGGALNMMSGEYNTYLSMLLIDTL